MIRMLPNFITSLRIFGTFCLLFIEPFTTTFYVVYTISGFSDVLDGFIARKFKVTSELGTKLDSIADLMFYIVMISRIFPVLLEKLPPVFWAGLVVVLIIRASAYILAAVKYHRFASLHTWLNKVTSAAVFAVPYAIELPFAVIFCFGVSVLGGVASVEELMIHILSPEYKAENRTLLALKK